MSKTGHPFDDRMAKAIDLTAEVAKQLIALATGILALTITFLKDGAGSRSDAAVALLAMGWVGYLVSMGCGVGVLMNIAGCLSLSDTVDLYKGSIRAFGCAQIVVFFVATIAVAVSALIGVVFGTPLTN